MEYLSQYDHTIMYIKSEDNTVADALSQLSNTIDDVPPPPVAALLKVETNTTLLQTLIKGYNMDPFCVKLQNASNSIDSVTWKNKLLYIGDCLVIPCIGSLCENLFWLAHNSLGHFGFDKSYAML